MNPFLLLETIAEQVFFFTEGWKWNILLAMNSPDSQKIFQNSYEWIRSKKINKKVKVYYAE